MAYVTPDFNALTALLRAHTAPKIGAELSEKLNVRPFDTAAGAEIARAWQPLSDAHDNPEQKEWRDIAYLRRQIGFAEVTESYSIWQQQNVIGVCIINALGDRWADMMKVCLIASCPGPHVLKGCLLASCHPLNLHLAKQSGDSTLLYHGGFSAGSVMQAERGALPGLTECARNSMWLGNSVHIAVDPTSDTDPLHQPGASTPPRTISAQYYAAAYQKLFGYPYTPPFRTLHTAPACP